MIEKALNEISKLLGQKFWFGGKLVRWEHPMNKVKDCIALTLDGCLQYKFKLHKNGKLRVMKVCSNRFLSLGLKPLQTITFQDLWCYIALKDNKYAGAFMQLTSPVPVPQKDFIALAPVRKEIEAARLKAEQLIGKV